ncbi:hypothetical protein CEXT_145751 [Caerostris extrusa]|uniref:Uncharacterized protein n=1 Tax=Caerostris extrusa TaxID=172846 RepID=A0AAV4W8P4_CAEEX|nr:hypothetical protein CEXT_145751 [Caerostris extrusa]
MHTAPIFFHRRDINRAILKSVISFRRRLVCFSIVISSPRDSPRVSSMFHLLGRPGIKPHRARMSAGKIRAAEMKSSSSGSKPKASYYVGFLYAFWASFFQHHSIAFAVSRKRDYLTPENEFLISSPLCISR